MPDNNEKILLENTKNTDNKHKLSDILGANPQLRTMLGKLSADDTRQLGAVLSDPEQLKKIMASPQAQKIMESLKKDNGGQK